MAQYQVPQFIETEDKIVGPLTLKQFLWLAAGAAVIFITFFTLKFFLWLILTIIVVVLSIALAFVKYNGRSLSVMMVSAFTYLWRPRKYTWQRAEKQIEIPKVKIPKMPRSPLAATTAEAEPAPMPLKNLWLKLTTSHEAAPKKPASKEHRLELFQLFKKLTGEREVARRVDYR